MRAVAKRGRRKLSSILRSRASAREDKEEMSRDASVPRRGRSTKNVPTKKARVPSHVFDGFRIEGVFPNSLPVRVERASPTLSTRTPTTESSPKKRKAKNTPEFA